MAVSELVHGSSVSPGRHSQTVFDAGRSAGDDVDDAELAGDAVVDGLVEDALVEGFDEDEQAPAASALASTVTATNRTLLRMHVPVGIVVFFLILLAIAIMR